MATQRKYDKEFKINAVKLYQESGKEQEEIARNLGIPKSTLYTWVQQYKTHGENGFPGSGSLLPHDKELHQLRKELADVKQERDILKKAIAIFSRHKG